MFRGNFHAMGSPCELLIAADDRKLAERVVNVAADEAWRIEDKFSRYLPGNIVHEINSSAGSAVEVDDETANLMDFAEHLYHVSENRFDITSGALRRAWSFDGSDNVPPDDDVKRILASVGWNKVIWQRPSVQLKDGMQIDFGGIGKEYAVDKTAGLVRELSDCSTLVNFGGDLVAAGRPRQPAGWQVGIESISATGTVAEKLIRLKTGALATSGDARRFLLKDGQRYGHILDPLTGWPVEKAPRSITVAADTCTQAGILATLAMLRGEQAEAFLNEQEVLFWCLR